MFRLVVSGSGSSVALAEPRDFIDVQQDAEDSPTVQGVGLEQLGG